VTHLLLTAVLQKAEKCLGLGLDLLLKLAAAAICYCCRWMLHVAHFYCIVHRISKGNLGP
jgi:hypothetical protein